MTSKAWQNLFRETADARRAQSSFDMLPPAAVKGMKAEDAKMLAAVLGGSECIPQWLVAHPEWLEIFDSNALKRTRRLAGLQRELNQLLKRQKDVDALAVIRRFKQREMVRIATRDLARLADVSEITAELSHVADVSLGAMLNICHERLRTKFGSPWHIGGKEAATEGMYGKGIFGNIFSKAEGGTATGAGSLWGKWRGMTHPFDPSGSTSIVGSTV